MNLFIAIIFGPFEPFGLNLATLVLEHPTPATIHARARPNINLVGRAFLENNDVDPPIFGGRQAAGQGQEPPYARRRRFASDFQQWVGKNYL